MSRADQAHWMTFDDRAAAAKGAADMIERALRAGLSDNGQASFMGSGGSTPAPVYDQLSGVDLAWDQVSIGLVDDRWVAPDHEASNEKLMRAHLLKDKAAAARFLPMKTDAESPKTGAETVNAAYRAAPQPFDAVLLGVGPDGHTASWFPGADTLDACLDPNNPNLVAGLNAQGAPVAGDYQDRITLTLSAIAHARQAVLVFFGDDKRAIVEQASQGETTALPVSYALEALGPRLTLFWAP